MSETITVWRAGRDDIAGAAAAFAAASEGEAVITWVIPDQDERRERIVRDPEAAEPWIGAVVATGEVVVAGTGPDEVAGVPLWEDTDPTSTSGDRSMAAASQDEADAAVAAAFEAVYGPPRVADGAADDRGTAPRRRTALVAPAVGGAAGSPGVGSGRSAAAPPARQDRRGGSARLPGGEFTPGRRPLRAARLPRAGRADRPARGGPRLRPMWPPVGG